MKRSVVLAIATAVGVTSLLPAQAAPPGPTTGTIQVTDGTPDPTGGGIGNPPKGFCDGKLPQEAGKPVTFPSAGKLKMDLTGFQGDWALAFRDDKGKFLAGDDANPPATEVASTKLKKGGTYLFQACNLGGTAQATIKYTFTPSK